jgi:hypothetical protein
MENLPNKPVEPEMIYYGPLKTTKTDLLSKTKPVESWITLDKDQTMEILLLGMPTTAPPPKSGLLNLSETEITSTSETYKETNASMTLEELPSTILITSGTVVTETETNGSDL